MAATVSELNGLYKQVYAKIIEDAVPNAAHLLKKIPFTPKDQQPGLYFNQPVLLCQEQGWTYLPAGGSTLSLDGSVDMQMQNAQVIGNIIAGQSQISVEAAKRAVSKGPAAFEDAVGLQMRNLMESGKKRQEINFLYGGTPVALVASNTNVNTTATILGIVPSEWASGLWAGMQSARFDVYQSDGATKINTTGPVSVLTSNAAQTSVTFTANAADITAINTYVANNANVTQLYFYGANGNESYGIKKQLTNSGTLFNINAAQYDLWNGTTYNANGSFVFSSLQKALAKAVARGLDEDVDVYVNPDTWTDMLNDQAALRRYVNRPSGIENGADELTFYGQNGKVNIVPHIFVKAGDAFILPMKKVQRIGVSEMTFNLPGNENGEVFIQLQSSLAVEYRCYSQETIFLPSPARCVYVSGIIN